MEQFFNARTHSGKICFRDPECDWIRVIHAAKNQVFRRNQTLLLYVHRYIFCVVWEQFQASFYAEVKYCLWGYLLDRIQWIIKIQIEKSSVSVGKECSFSVGFVQLKKLRLRGLIHNAVFPRCEKFEEATFRCCMWVRLNAQLLSS